MDLMNILLVQNHHLLHYMYYLDNNKYKNSSISINLEDIRLLNMENGFHRRIRSYG